MKYKILFGEYMPLDPDDWEDENEDVDISGIKDLENQVNEAIKIGWEPLGGITAFLITKGKPRFMFRL